MGFPLWGPHFKCKLDSFQSIDKDESFLTIWLEDADMLDSLAERVEVCGRCIFWIEVEQHVACGSHGPSDSYIIIHIYIYDHFQYMIYMCEYSFDMTAHSLGMLARSRCPRHVLGWRWALTKTQVWIVQLSWKGQRTAGYQWEFNSSELSCTAHSPKQANAYEDGDLRWFSEEHGMHQALMILHDPSSSFLLFMILFFAWFFPNLQSHQKLPAVVFGSSSRTLQHCPMTWTRLVTLTTIFTLGIQWTTPAQLMCLAGESSQVPLGQFGAFDLVGNQAESNDFFQNIGSANICHKRVSVWPVGWAKDQNQWSYIPMMHRDTQLHRPFTGLTIIRLLTHLHGFACLSRSGHLQPLFSACQTLLMFLTRGDPRCYFERSWRRSWKNSRNLKYCELSDATWSTTWTSKCCKRPAPTGKSGGHSAESHGAVYQLVGPTSRSKPISDCHGTHSFVISSTSHLWVNFIHED